MEEIKELKEITEIWKLEQETLRKLLVMDDAIQDINNVRYVAGVDLSFFPGGVLKACAGLVILSYPDLKLQYENYEIVEMNEPYIPGFLAFREVTHLVKLFRKFESERPELRPDVMFVDGNGLLHPEKFGSACHLGVLLDIPTVAIAKNLFDIDGLNHKVIKDRVQKECLNDGEVLPLIGVSGYLWGYAMPNSGSTRRPIYVSGGHRVSVETALKLSQKCCIYRIPEPIRRADLGSREYIRQFAKAILS
jgi:deoxyinosine 3'endonuclease (endonuclease V)